MPCYFPVTLYMSKTLNPETGRRSLVSITEGYRDKPKQVACGRCVGCRLERSRQWAIRCEHERQKHEENSFLTLTYRDEELVYGGQSHGILVPEHLQRFWKRFRKHIWKHERKRIRYFACGEYGDESNRPHYHACVFGFDFQDKTLDSSKNGVNYYHSDLLDNLWTHGRCIIGDVTWESAAYVARYVMKKRLGNTAVTYKQEGITPEFVVMSRRPGIGATWFDEFESDVFPSDQVSVRGGVKCKPPKFYQRRYEKTHPLTMEEIREARLDEAATRWRDNKPDRLGVRYRVKMAQIQSLKRHL